MVILDEKWPTTLLTGLRQQGDPLADEAVHKLFEYGAVDAVNQLLTKLVRNDEVPPTGLASEIYEYLRATEPPPFDQHLVAEGEACFKQHGNLALVVLLCAS